MRSALDVRQGCLEPVILHLPPDVVSLDAAEEAIELADAYGICDGHPLAESQKITLRGAMGERADGRWAATRVGDFGPRQGTGKNDKIAARELAGLILLAEPLIIHTAHEFPTANEAFLRLVALFENYDDLRRRVRRVLYGNGTQSINFRSGQRILYKARTGGAGRGFTKAALVVYDEAQHLSSSHVAASGPTKLANPNAQTWYAGSGGFETSAKAWEMRRQAILGTGGRLAYTEATAEQVDVVNGRIVCHAPDVEDLEAWYRAMPGLGRWVTEESMRAMLVELGPDDFAREGLCVWDPEPGDLHRVIPAESWIRCLNPEKLPSGSLCFALDVSPDAASTAIAVSDGKAIDVVAHRPGTAWVVAELLERRDKFQEIVLDPAGPAGALLKPLEAAKIPVREVTLREHVAAAGQLLIGILDGNVTHLGQAALDAAVAAADRRDVGDGGWLWSRRRSSVDISPLVAATLARGFVPSVTRPPRIHTLAPVGNR